MQFQTSEFWTLVLSKDWTSEELTYSTFFSKDSKSFKTTAADGLMPLFALGLPTAKSATA